jgi:NAD(P)-dependent dehydrogenase (short-subunit alcohol dehydrogenase family)
VPDAPGPLAGRRALVTGAGRGIGRAIALGLAAAGAEVVCSDLSEPVATTDEIVEAGGGSSAMVLDIADADSIDGAMAQIATLGGLDIIVNNAGIFPRSPILDMPVGLWDEVVGVNLRGTFLCCQAAARAMRNQGRGGRIVNITSGAAFVPTAASAHYAASKAGIVALTRVLALELAQFGITANAVAPGLVDTEQPRSYYSDDELAAFAQRIPSGRLGEPRDIGPVVVMLCGDGASYLTGQTIHVNGGLYMP